MSEDEHKAWMIVGMLVLPLGAALLAVYAIWDGWVLAKLWLWFMVPIFHLPTITISVAIGLSLIIGLLTHQYQIDPKDATAAQKWLRATAPFISGVVALIVGWIVRP